MLIFEELFDYEKRVNANQKSRAHRFVKNADWYVNERYMKKIFAYPVLSSENKIPGLSRTHARGLMAQFLFGGKTRESFPSTADAIAIKRTHERLRGFYVTGHPRPHTVKIVCDSPRHKLREATEREVGTRQRLLALNTIRIPKVLGTEQREEAFVLCEELIMGRRFNIRLDRTLHRSNLLPQLRDTYRAYGVRYAPIETYLPPHLDQQITELLGEKADGKRFKDALHKVIEKNGQAAVSLCHGGLVAGNLAVANGTVFFLDWKLAHEGPIAFDLLKLGVRYPRFAYIVRNIREMMAPDFTEMGCSFDDLLTAFVGRDLIRKPAAVARYLYFWQRHVA